LSSSKVNWKSPEIIILGLKLVELVAHDELAVDVKCEVSVRKRLDM
jgi:hypothetical protein